VAPIVSTLVAATASSAHGAQHGHDSLRVSSIFATNARIAETAHRVE
jgi:hypothetical protein